MGSRRIGKRRIRSLQDAKQSASDEWGLVRPAAIACAGLSRSIKSVQLGQMHGFGIEDLSDTPAEDQTTALWVRDTDNSAAIATVSNDADFTDGAFSITTGGTGGHQTAVGLNTYPFKCTTNKPWWVETAIKLADHDATEFFFGLTETDINADSFHLAAAGADADRIGFVKAAHNADAVTYACSANAAGTISTMFDTAIAYDTDNDQLGMGIHWDGNGQIHFYNSSVTATGTELGAWTKNTTVSAGVPTDSDLAVVLMLETGEGSTKTAVVNYIRGAWTV
jgi:hypothetical protein